MQIQQPASPSSGPRASAPIGNVVSACCFCNDYEKEISTETEFRYHRRFDSTGALVNFAMWTRYRLLVPLKTGSSVTVESRLRMAPDAGLTSADQASAKAKLDAGVNQFWNGAFILLVQDPQCPVKALRIVYQPKWVESGEHRKVQLHRVQPREYLQQSVMNVGLNTDEQTYAHEYGHAVGKPDEYSYTIPRDQTVRYVQPDGTLGPSVLAAGAWPASPGPDDSLMGYGTGVRERHAWSVAIEAQELLTKELHRSIRCTIARGAGF